VANAFPLPASHHARAALQSLRLLAEAEPLMGETAAKASALVAEALEALDASDRRAQVEAFALFMDAAGS
jgi:hypothetical protein